MSAWSTGHRHTTTTPHTHWATIQRERERKRKTVIEVSSFLPYLTILSTSLSSSYSVVSILYIVKVFTLISDHHTCVLWSTCILSSPNHSQMIMYKWENMTREKMDVDEMLIIGYTMRVHHHTSIEIYISYSTFKYIVDINSIVIIHSFFYIWHASFYA